MQLAAITRRKHYNGIIRVPRTCTGINEKKNFSTENLHTFGLYSFLVLINFFVRVALSSVEKMS